MEVVLPCGVGVLTAGCVLGLLGAFGSASSETAPGSPGDRARWLPRATEALGRMLLATGLFSREIVQDVVGTVRSMRIRGKCPFDAASEAMAMGAVAACCPVAGVGALVLSGSAFGFALGVAGAPIAVAWRIARKRRERMRCAEEAMPEAFGALAISLGSGLSLAQAMSYVGGHAGEPVRSEFMRVSFSITCGISAAQALDDMIGRLHAPGLELVALALKVSQRTGAPLKDLLAEASRLVGDRIELARRLDVKTSQARMSAQLVACMPVAMIGFLSLLSSDFQAGMATLPGMCSVAAALVLNAFAWAIIRKIMQVRL